MTTSVGRFEILEPRSVDIPAGGNSTVDVRVARRGYEGTIEISLEDLPVEVSHAKATIAAGEDRTKLTIHAPGPLFEGTSTIRATSGKSVDTAPLHLRVGDTRAQLGKLDARFHGRGYVPIDAGEMPAGIARVAPNHLVAIGRNCSLWKYDLETGALDTTMPVDTFSRVFSHCDDVVDGADGRTYAAVFGSSKHIVRFLDDGARDPSFAVNVADGDVWAVDPSGRVVVVSPSGDVRRRLANGATDDTFVPTTIPLLLDKRGRADLMVAATDEAAFVVGADRDPEDPESQRFVRARVTATGEVYVSPFSVGRSTMYVSAGVSWVRVLPNGDVVAAASIYDFDAWTTTGFVVRARRDGTVDGYDLRVLGRTLGLKPPLLDASGALVAVGSSSVHNGPSSYAAVRIPVDSDSIYTEPIRPSLPGLDDGWVLPLRLVPLRGGVSTTIAPVPGTGKRALVRVWTDR